jgi:hypothetical protein
MKKDLCVIVPTIRDFHIMKDYFKNAREGNFDLGRMHVLLVTEDFCETDKMKKMLNEEDVEGEIFGQKDRDAWFKENGIENFSDLVPKKSHAETSFGLLWMWANNFENGIFIDDDTLPVGKDYFGTHMKNLDFNGEIDVVSSDKKWVNVLYQKKERIYPRGYPYSCMNETFSAEKKKISNVVASQGLWTNNPDLDAVRILINGGLDGVSTVYTKEEDFKNNFSVERGNYLTVCSMNLAFKKEIIPCFYQLPMDDNPWKVGRFDDIWSGVFLKRACDILGKQMINGFPLCQHNKAPRSTFKDLNSEVPALEINEYLWSIVEEIDAGGNYFSIYNAFADVLEKKDFNFISLDFIRFMAQKMRKWTECLDKLG